MWITALLLEDFNYTKCEWGDGVCADLVGTIGVVFCVFVLFYVLQQWGARPGDDGNVFATGYWCDQRCRVFSGEMVTVLVIWAPLIVIECLGCQLASDRVKVSRRCLYERFGGAAIHIGHWYTSDLWMI